MMQRHSDFTLRLLHLKHNVLSSSQRRGLLLCFFLFFHVLLMWIHCMPAAGSITVAVHMLDYIDSIF